jgi:phospholipase D1/2
MSRVGVAISTTWNPNHRHDEPWEQEIDAKFMAIRDSHRFRSFAPEREGNLVKWHVDGWGAYRMVVINSESESELTADYFWALSELIDQAKSSILILDWWLSPELQVSLTLRALN